MALQNEAGIYLDHLSERFSQFGIGQEDWQSIARGEQWHRVLSSIGNYSLDEWADQKGLWVMNTTTNPGACHTDMPNAVTLQKLEEDGVIIPGKTRIVDISSGSVGRSQAWITKQMGYNLTVFSPECLPENRIAPTAALGAEIVLQGQDIPDTVKALKRYLASLRERESIKGDNYSVMTGQDMSGQHICWLNHPGNQITIDAQRHLGEQLRKQVDNNNMTITHILSVIGNGTSTRGIVEGFDSSGSLLFVGVEPTEGAVHFTKLHPEFQPNFKVAHPIWGASREKTPLSINPAEFVNDIRLVDAEHATRYAVEHNSDKKPEQTIGNTTALAILAAKKLIQEVPDAQIATLWYDNGYLN